MKVLYVEPFMILKDYWKSLRRDIVIFEYVMPFIVVVFSSVYMLINDVNSYDVVRYAHSMTEILLGFTVAAMALFLSGGENLHSLKNYTTNVLIRGNNISLFQLIILRYTYQVIICAFLCVAFLVGCCFSIDKKIVCLFFNCSYVFSVISVCCSFLKSVTDLYWILIKK